MFRKLIYIFFITTTFLYSNNKICLYINSYHKEYSWSDEIAKEINLVLKNSCEVIQFDMDTKRNKNISDIEQKATEAKELILKIKPDIVITSDDNAAKYLIQPYFKNSKIPFVFSGINWTVKEYGFPYNNVTGIIEILPIKQLFTLAIDITKGNNGLFLGDDTITDKKDLKRFLNYANKHNIILDSALVHNIEEWKKEYLQAQEKYDFIILGHNSVIKDWNEEEIKSFQLTNSKKLVLSTYSWMLPYSMIGLTIKAKEQGHWAAKSAKAILDGFLIKNISISTNKTWNSYINMKLVNNSKISLPRMLIVKSKKYEEDK